MKICSKIPCQRLFVFGPKKIITLLEWFIFYHIFDKISINRIPRSFGKHKKLCLPFHYPQLST